MPRIIYLTVQIPLGYGEEFFIDEMLELSRQGVELIIVPRSPISNHITQSRALGLNDNCVYQPLLSPAIIWNSLMFFFKNHIKVMNLLYSLIKEKTAIKNHFKNLIVFPKALWIACLVKIKKADHIHAQWASTTATMAMIASEITGIPWSFTAHRGDIKENNLLSMKIQRASFVRFISESGVELARKQGATHLEEKSHVIHMGVTFPQNDNISAENESDINIMCPANLIEVKGHKYLLSAIEILCRRDVHCSLLLVGQGILLSKLQKQSEDIGISEKVEFLGQIPHEDLLNMYRTGRITMVVLPSIDLGDGLHEGIPVSLMEAMAHGIPVISTNTGGIPELLRGGAGIMVSPNSAEALADAIEMLIKDTDARRNYIEAGRTRIKNEFAIESVVNKLLNAIANPLCRN